MAQPEQSDAPETEYVARLSERAVEDDNVRPWLAARGAIEALIADGLSDRSTVLPAGDDSYRFALVRAVILALREAREFAAEAKLIDLALTIRPSPRLAMLRSIALANAQNYDAAQIAADRALIDDPSLGSDEFAGHLAELASYRKITDELRELAHAPSPRGKTARSGPVAYCLHNSLPYAQGGYAMRSHALTKALKEAGYEMLVCTRPGFPTDGAARHAEPAERAEIDGICYHFSNDFGRRGRVFAYIAEAADYWQSVFENKNVALVHAATNFWTALPAAIAAHRLGLPFIYEVRSFWAITRESYEPGFSKTAQARRDEALERITLALADKVVTLNGAMRDHLTRYRVEPDRVSIAPNCVDTDRFRPAARDPELAARYGIAADDIVIGYIGAMRDYEGLDILVDATAPLLHANDRLKLVIIGIDPARIEAAGTVENGLAARIGKIGDADSITLAETIAPDDAPAHYALFDMCVYPRRGDQICELVSPLKPLEAMASGKAVIVSDVGGMRDIVEHGVTGLVVPREDGPALHDAVAVLVDDQARRAALGEQARSAITATRRWNIAADAISACYRALLDSESRHTPQALDSALSALETRDQNAIASS